MWIAIILFWLLCGSWAIRMEEKDNKQVICQGSYIMVAFGCISVLLAFSVVWVPRLWDFAKGIRDAWKQALKG